MVFIFQFMMIVKKKTYEICNEWCNRTGMNLSYDKYTRLVQRDVNSILLFAKMEKLNQKARLNR